MIPIVVMVQIVSSVLPLPPAQAVAVLARLDPR